MKNEYMTFDDILKGLHVLAHSQGFYGRLLDSIYSLDEEDFMNFKKHMENQKFEKLLDVVLYFEC